MALNQGPQKRNLKLAPPPAWQPGSIDGEVYSIRVLALPALKAIAFVP